VRRVARAFAALVDRRHARPEGRAALGEGAVDLRLMSNRPRPAFRCPERRNASGYLPSELEFSVDGSQP
jgi:hypothetical protein